MNKRGFTLIEIMLVVIIIAVLAAMVVPSFAGRSDQARRSAVQADIEANLAVALDLYDLDNGSFPTTAQGLKALIEKPDKTSIPPNWNGPYLKKRRIPIDPWGNEYFYVSPGEHNPQAYDLFSYGPDGQESDDDIHNWQEDEL